MASAEGLFRPEVLQAAQGQWLGSIRIARPPSFAWVTSIAMALAAALIAFAVLGQVSRKARLPGLLLPSEGLIGVSAPQAGTVAELLVSEGQQVQAGQPLLRLSSPRLLTGGDATALAAQALAQRRSALATERLLLQQQARQRDDALNDRLRSLQTEARQAEAELDTHRLRAQLAAKSQARFEELGRSGFVSPAQTQQKHEELLDLQLRERNAQRNSEALQREIQSLQAERQANRTALATSLAQLERSLASLSQEVHENEARGGLIVAAPQAGTVSALVPHAGQAVQPGQTLLSLVPEARAGHDTGHNTPGSSAAPLQAQLYAPSRTAGFVQAGQTVWLRYAAYPYQKFGMAQGTVAAVSQTPIAPQDLPAGQAQALLAAAQSQEPLYRITVNLAQQHINTYGQAQALKAGMSLEADVMQERRAVWEWVLEPVLAVSGSAKNLITSPVNLASPGG
ncbi:MAG: HlyD family secretion protein [Roseateles asaccharophilus]